MSYAAHGRGSRSKARRTARSLLMLPMAIFLGVTLLAAAYVAYVLWPRWPGPTVSSDTPSLPIVVAGSLFNVPPAAIRVRVQRRPGVQERVDLAFLWPSLLPPDAASNLAATTAAPTGAAAGPTAPDQVFMTIANSGGALAPLERIKTIYPRYLSTTPVAGPNGLIALAFRSDTPYRGEDLLYPPDSPERFVLRCSRPGGPTPGTCLYERRIGEADITVRFPRDWLDDWQGVAGNVDRLIGSLLPRKAEN
jgi:hypothetical protein